MEMMYKIIADELKAMDIKDLHPQDYLNFFCLGNREEPTSNGSLESEKSSDKSAAVIYCCTSFLILQTKKKNVEVADTKTYLTCFLFSTIYSCAY